MRWLYKLMREELLFTTYTGNSYKKGDIHKGYKITRFIDVTMNGPKCYEVWGKHL